MVFPIWSSAAEVDKARLVGMKREPIPSKPLAQDAEDPLSVAEAGFDARYMAGGHYAWKALKGAAEAHRQRSSQSEIMSGNGLFVITPSGQSGTKALKRALRARHRGETCVFL
jgi:hypothetical protein